MAGGPCIEFNMQIKQQNELETHIKATRHNRRVAQLESPQEKVNQFEGQIDLTDSSELTHDTK